MENIPDLYLVRFGYAPGQYCGICNTCKKEMDWVDKRAACCRPCAVLKFESNKEIIRQLEEKQETLDKPKFVELTDEEVNKIWHSIKGFPSEFTTRSFVAALQKAWIKKNGG